MLSTLLGQPAGMLPLAADRGFSFADPYAIALAFAGVAVFAAIGALSHQHERAFSASLIYLGLGLAAATMIDLLGVRWIDPLSDATLIEHLAEFALIVALFATALKRLSLGAAIILGAALAPTDPVLAGDVGVGPPGEEEEDEPRVALTGEAGLNDGLAFPFVFLGLFAASEP